MLEKLYKEIAEKEVQDTSCRGYPPNFKKSPKIGGLGGCLKQFQQSFFLGYESTAELKNFSEIINPFQVIGLQGAIISEVNPGLLVHFTEPL